MFVAMQTLGDGLAIYQGALAVLAGAGWTLLRFNLVKGLYPETGRHRAGEPVEAVLTRCLAPGGEKAPPVRHGRGSRAYRRLPTYSRRLDAAEASATRKSTQLRTAHFADIS